MHQFVYLMFLLLIAHSVCDFALQSDAMAKGKNRHRVPDYIPEGQKYIPCWPYWMSAHAFIHGGGVYLATGNPVFGCVEVIHHWLIDFAKCDNHIDPNGDQFLHLLAKVIYALMSI